MRLPPEARLDGWKVKNPVCKLKKALYGHPDAGTLWERHCDKNLKRVGFVPFQNWSGAYWHDEYKLFLCVYVDDFKLCGPKDAILPGWKLIEKHLNLDPPEEFGRYLGCQHILGHATLSCGTPVRTIEYDMKPFLVSTLENTWILQA